MTPFILASASPRRRQILDALGFRFRVEPADAPEIDRDLYPGRVALTNAINKAAVLADRYPDRLILGADTVIEFGERIIGKPADLADARRILSELSGHTHQVVTAVALLQRERRIRCVFCARTDVTFHRLEPHAVDAYLARVDVLDKAGAYAVQEHGEMLVEKIDGPFDNVVGLPGDMVCDALRCCGVVPA